MFRFGLVDIRYTNWVSCLARMWFVMFVGSLVMFSAVSVVMLLVSAVLV